MPHSKPVILSVDDDAEVLAAVERDLRAHYGGEYRIVKSNLPQEALDTADEFQRRGTAVALFLVDHRMPEMTGVEFLRAAARLHPEARKVLLTAYADTQAAIDSINDIGLDYYLLKPWSPPDERLYPVLDDLLSDWKGEARLPYEGVRVVGSNWSAPCYEIKDFLSRNHVPYQWVEIERDTAMKQLCTTIAGDPPRLPVLLFPDGTHLVSPSHRELAEKVGIQTRPKLAFYDVVIVGGGPAGLAAAVYGASEGLKTLMVEQAATGGQAGTSSRIENYLGFPSGLTGKDLARRATIQAVRFGAELVGAQEAVGIRREDPFRVVRMADGSEVSTKVVLLAMGVSVRTLDVPGAALYAGAGLFYGAALTEAATYRDQHVCIVGGANSAGQGALFFARYASRVTMLVRADSLSRGMSQYLVDRIAQIPNIAVVTRVEVVGLGGEGKLDRVGVRNLDSGDESEVATAALFVFIGAAPRTEMVAGLVARDEKGYILTGPDLPLEKDHPRGWPLDRDPHLYETNVPGVFAVGDVRAGSGKRVAAAVGEGSATVMMVHRYLETV